MATSSCASTAGIQYPYHPADQHVDDDEKVIGLEIGADDYMTKPFRPRAGGARRAVLRRAGDSHPSGKVLKAADIVLDRDSRTVRVDEQFVDLTPSEFDILTALMTSPGTGLFTPGPAGHYPGGPLRRV